MRGFWDSGVHGPVDMTQRKSFHRIDLSVERRQVLAARLVRFVDEEHDEVLSSFRAQALVDFFLRELGPPVYNQAIQDARGFLQERLDDLDAEFYEPESRSEAAPESDQV